MVTVTFVKLTNRHPVIANEPHWRKFDIGSGNDFVPSDREPLSKPMLTQIHVAIWHH